MLSRGEGMCKPTGSYNTSPILRPMSMQLLPGQALHEKTSGSISLQHLLFSETSSDHETTTTVMVTHEEQPSLRKISFFTAEGFPELARQSQDLNLGEDMWNRDHLDEVGLEASTELNATSDHNIVEGESWLLFKPK